MFSFVLLLLSLLPLWLLCARFLPIDYLLTVLLLLLLRLVCSIASVVVRRHLYASKYYYIKIKYTPAVRSKVWKISSKLIFPSCVCYSDGAYYWVCVLRKYVGWRLPLELACTKVNRVMLSNLCMEAIKPVFEGGSIYLTAVECMTSILCMSCLSTYQQAVIAYS